MNRARSSYSDMIKTVLCVQHTELKPHHRVLLNAIAAFTNESGKGSRPTYAFLRVALGDVGETWVRNGLKKLRKWKLVERTHQGKGPGDASVFRICLENPAFPDEYPTLKQKVPTLRSAAIEESPIPAPAGSNTRTAEPEYPHSEGQIPALRSADHPFFHPNPPSNPPSQQLRKTEGGKDFTNPTPSAIAEWISKTSEVLYDEPTKAIQQQILAVAIPFGEDAVPMLATRFDHFKARAKGFGGLNQPWGFFVREELGKMASTPRPSVEEAQRLRAIERGRAQAREINQIPEDEPEIQLAPGEVF
jgi:hypothetical protein